MKSPSAFEFESYRAILAFYLTGDGNRGKLTEAANALNCQRSYLSRVIADRLHLTLDHAFKIAAYFEFKGNEREYFLTLVEFERAADPNYKKFLSGKLADLRCRHQARTTDLVQAVAAEEMRHPFYFSSWIFGAVHMLTDVPEFQTLASLGARLGIPSEAVLQYLKLLEAKGLVVQKKGKWLYRPADLHSPKESPLTVLNHQNWRARAVLDSQDFTNDSLHVTALGTMSRKDASRIKELLIDSIKKAGSIARPSPSEDCMVLTCDFFKV